MINSENSGPRKSLFTCLGEPWLIFFFFLLMDNECHVAAGSSDLHIMFLVLFSASKSCYKILTYKHMYIYRRTHMYYICPFFGLLWKL